MALKNRKRVIYFVKGRQPKQEQIDRAVKMAEDVVFRNALMVGPEDKCEQCDAVMGFVPAQYKKADIPVISIKKEATKDDASGAKGGEGTKAPTAPANTATQQDAKS